MEKNRRYSQTIDLYHYARNDNEAKVMSAKLTEFLNKEFGCQAKTLELNETPIASLDSRLIHKGNLTLFNNKIIES